MHKIIVVLIFTSLICFSCQTSDVNSFNKEDIFSKIWNNTKNQKKYIYFNVWSTSCIPCIKEMPSLDSLAGFYNNIEFVFLTEENNEKVSRFFKKKNIHLKNCIFINDEKSTIQFLMESTNKGKMYPFHFIVDNKFNIIHNHAGYIDAGKGYDPILVKALKNLK